MLAQRESQLRTDARRGHGAQGAHAQRLRRQPRRVPLGLESQPGPVAGEAQQSRGVVDEAALVQHAQSRGREILERVCGGV